MKIQSLFYTAAICLGVAGCGGNSHKDSEALADSANTTLDSLHSKKYPDSHRVLSGPDAKFAVAAYGGGLAEVELAQLAQEKAQNQQVKDFAGMMIKDHTDANVQLKQIADAHKVVMPAGISAKAQKLKAELSAKSGADFDKAYVDAMVDDHQKDIETFDQALNVIKYPDLQTYARQTLPVLKKHLGAVQQIKSTLK